MKLILLRLQSHTRIILLVVALLAVVGSIGGVVTWRKHNRVATPSINQPGTVQTQPDGTTSPPPNATPTPGTTPPPNAKDPTGPTTEPPAIGTVIAPTGNFVSNHSARLNKDSGENRVNSVCITSPGAKCFIRFTNGTTVKKLDEKTVGTDGTTEWNWQLQDIGLFEGSWQIEAVAASGSATKTTKDTARLEVRP